MAQRQRQQFAKNNIAARPDGGRMVLK